MVVRGIFSSGSDEDQYIYCLLPVAQAFAGKGECGEQHRSFGAHNPGQ